MHTIKVHQHLARYAEVQYMIYKTGYSIMLYQMTTDLDPMLEEIYLVKTREEGKNM